MSNPGKNIPANIVYDPVAKYLVKAQKNYPSFLEYEKKHEDSVTIKSKIVLKN